MQAPLCDRKYRLERFPGKGGWTYAHIPECTANGRKFSISTKVSGRIDDHVVENATLMPMGNRRYFIPINAGIRKKIGKEAGDWVHITLYTNDTGAPVATDDFTDCLKDEPAAWQHYRSFSKTEQQAWINWVNGPADEKARVERIATAVNRIARGQTLEKP